MSAGLCQKRKCGADPPVSKEVLAKPGCKQTETIPHSYRLRRSDGAVVVLTFVETVRFLGRTVRKHFHQYVRHTLPRMTLQI